MNELLGFVIALFSTLLAGVVSGLRLRPYLDAGEVYTPPTFALYPALIATGLSLLLVLVVCQWQRKATVRLGPVSFTGKQFFAVLWCLVYVLVALTCFPYQPPLAPREHQPRTNIASPGLPGAVKFHRALLRE